MFLSKDCVEYAAEICCRNAEARGSKVAVFDENPA